MNLAARSCICISTLFHVALLIVYVNGSTPFWHNIRTETKRSTNRPFLPVAFAGFGGGGKSSKTNGKKKVNSKNSSSTKQHNLFTPQGRMEHIQQRIAEADISSIAKLKLTSTKSGEEDQFHLDIDPNAIAVVDNFLGEDLIKSMRNEA